MNKLIKKYCFKKGVALLFLFFSALILTNTAFADEDSPGETSPKTIAIFPLTLHAEPNMSYLEQGISSMLRSRLADEGFRIIGAENITTPANKDDAESAAKQLGADYIIYGDITSLGSGYSLDVSVLDMTKSPSRLSNATDAGSHDQLIPRLSDFITSLKQRIEGQPTFARGSSSYAAQPEAKKGLFSSVTRSELSGPTERGIFYRSSGTAGFEPSGSVGLQINPLAFDIGDLDGDGINELIVLNRRKMLIYKHENGKYVPLFSLSTESGDDFLKVSIGDGNRDGKAEIYLVSWYGLRARTTVYQWDGKLNKLAQFYGHTKIIKDWNKKSIILFRESKIDYFISGEIHSMNWEGKTLKDEGPLPGLKDAEFYSLTRHDIDKKGAPQWFGLDKDNRLCMWDVDGSLVWKGQSKVGGTNNSIDLSKGGEAPTSSGPPKEWYFQPRIIITDIDGDGTDDVVVPQNVPIADSIIEYLLYTKGSIKAYSRKGAGLDASWGTRELNYCINDMQVDEHGAIFFIAETPKLSNIGSGSGRILWFE